MNQTNKSELNRSILMSRVKSKNTTPERVVRSSLHKMGYRFRLHRKDLPGCPDIVLPKYKTVILVHGCFWHQHKGCQKAKRPKTRTKFWNQKLDKNIERDSIVEKELIERDWKIVIIWECETKNKKTMEEKIKSILKTKNTKVLY